LIISNCPAHSVDIKLTAIHLVFCHWIQPVSCSLATRALYKT
jgi:hypothetical protein